MEKKPIKLFESLSVENMSSKDTSKPGREEEVISQKPYNPDINQGIENTAERRFQEGLADNDHTEPGETEKT